MAKAPAKAQEEVQEDLLAQIGETPDQTPLEKEEENPEPEIQDEPEEQEDAAVVLQKQLEALKKSEEAQKQRAERYRQEAEEARQQAAQRAREANKGRQDTVQAQFDAVSTALAAAQNEAESAKREIKAAIVSADIDAQADAYERLAAAQANISSLSAGKVELETRIKNPPQEETEKNAIPQRVQRWLQRHPEYMSDPRKNDKLRALHWDVLEEGHDFDSNEYIESMEIKLGIRKSQQDEEEPETPARKSSSPQVSAPVSREAPGGSPPKAGQIKLTPQQREAAKVAGITEKQYAEQLVKLREAKANGMYGGGQ